jgi:XTP/dITP diphosphohydrolase/tetrapyrrole methylase family protein/MazG family protein
VWKQIEKKKLPAEGLVDADAVRQLEGELDEGTIGRRLFELAAACRARGLDPEAALRRETARVMAAVEQRIAAAKPDTAVPR